MLFRSSRRTGHSRGGVNLGPRNCYGCGNPNHIRKDCPFAQIAPQTVGQPHVRPPFPGPYQEIYRLPLISALSIPSAQSFRPNVLRGQFNHVGHRGGGQQTSRPPHNIFNLITMESSIVAPDISVIRGMLLVFSSRASVLVDIGASCSFASLSYASSLD